MLRVIGEFDDVKVAIVALHEVRLCAAAHFSDQPSGMDGHWLAAKVCYKDYFIDTRSAGHLN